MLNKNEVEKGSKSWGSPVVRKAIQVMVNKFSEDLTLDQIAKEVRVSKYFFCRQFQKECGLTPIRWLWLFRTLLASEFIKLAPDWSLTNIAFACGFTSSAHFCRSIKTVFGCSPTVLKGQSQKVLSLRLHNSFSKILEENRETIEAVVKKVLSRAAAKASMAID